MCVCVFLFCYQNDLVKLVTIASWHPSHILQYHRPFVFLGPEPRLGQLMGAGLIISVNLHALPVLFIIIPERTDGYGPTWILDPIQHRSRGRIQGSSWTLSLTGQPCGTPLRT